MSGEASELRSDILIVGASYTGLLAALSFARTLGPETRIIVTDKMSPDSIAADPRCFALSASSRRLLAALGVWELISSEAQDVTTIALTDTPLDAAVRPVLLDYDNRLETGEAGASIVPGAALLTGLMARVQDERGIRVITGVEATALEPGPALSVMTDATGRRFTAPLVIAADGRGSRIRQLAGIRTTGFRHGQAGIVAIIRHSEPHHGCAIQHFLPSGPFAILPLRGNRSCITWSEEAHAAERIMALDTAGFLGEIARRAGGRLGEISIEGTPASFPLSSHVAREFIGPRLVLVGDAAHGVHPIAGQGLNLAMRDAAVLAQCVGEAVKVGLDFGDGTALERYQRWRRFDSTVSTGVFDGLNRLFSNDASLLRSVREAGLGLVNRMPGLKRTFVREAAGLSGDLPDLMQEPVATTSG